MSDGLSRGAFGDASAIVLPPFEVLECCGTTRWHAGSERPDLEEALACQAKFVNEGLTRLEELLERRQDTPLEQARLIAQCADNAQLGRRVVLGRLLSPVHALPKGPVHEVSLLLGKLAKDILSAARIATSHSIKSRKALEAAQEVTAFLSAAALEATTALGYIGSSDVRSVRTCADRVARLSTGARLVVDDVIMSVDASTNIGEHLLARDLLLTLIRGLRRCEGLVSRVGIIVADER